MEIYQENDFRDADYELKFNRTTSQNQQKES